MKQHIPNALTCGNVVCGCLGIVQALQGELAWAAFFIALGSFFDFFDGFAARMLNVKSNMGKELDSLADMVTFGVLPAFIMMQMMSQTDWVAQNPYWVYGSLAIAVFSALRLAMFNVDTRQTDSFIGLPTPANTIFIGALPLAAANNPTIADWLGNYWLLLGISLLSSYMLVAELPLFSLKFKNFGFAGNEIRYIFLGLSVVMLAVLTYLAVPLIIFLYVLLSVANNLIFKTQS